MKTPRARAIVTAATASVALFGCRQIVGIEDNPPEALTETACGMPFGTSACASCAAASCCDQATRCGEDPTCSAYESCLGGCKGAPDCRAQCTVKRLVGTSPAVSALSACLANDCQAACGLTCGGVEGYITAPTQAAECQSCVSASACDHASAWASSVDGDAYWRCYLACSTPDCRDGCGDAHPEGASLFATFQADFSGTCANACKFGEYWECASRVTWPKPAASALADPTHAVSQFSIPFFDLSRNPIAGANVAVCTSCPCGFGNTIWWQGQTSASGAISGSYAYPLDPAGFGLNGCFEITSDALGLVPTFCYWGFPLSQRMDVASPNLGFTIETTVQAQTLASLAQFTIDPSRAVVLAATAFDCLGFAAPNVTFALQPPDPQAIPFYGLSPMGLSQAATDSSGIGGFFNLATGAADAGQPAPGVVTITATPRSLNAPSSAIALPIMAGAATEVAMFPAPQAH